MDLRKLQFIGGSSYMISIPKKWVEKNELSSGDRVAVSMYENHIIITPPRISEQEFLKKAVIKGLPQLSGDFLRRFIYALYIQGFDEIVIETEMPTKIVGKISEIIWSLIGMEIIDSSGNRIVMRCLNDPSFDIFSVLSRLVQITIDMLEGIEDGIREEDFSSLPDIAKLEKDADRLYMLATRIEHRSISDTNMAVKWDDIKTIVGIRLIAKLIEEIADFLKDYAEHVSRIDKSYFKLHLELLGKIKELFEKVYKAYLDSDLNSAEATMHQLNRLMDEIKNLMEEDRMGYYILSLDDLYYVCKNIKSILEIAFNKGVRKYLAGMTSKTP
jgi:phosphate uptake regulator